MNIKNTLRNALFAFLLAANAIAAFADPARVVSKQENIPHGKNNLKTRLFLDTTMAEGNNRANAYVDLYNINRFMSLQEFSDMIQPGDILEYTPASSLVNDGRYEVISFMELLELNGDNIYRIFAEDLKDANYAYGMDARVIYDAQRGN
jgi:hypothetical protein